MSKDRPVPRFFRRTCAQCGHEWLGATSSCPACGGVSKSTSEEFTKKVVDDNDMKKGF